MGSTHDGSLQTLVGDPEPSREVSEEITQGGRSPACPHVPNSKARSRNVFRASFETGTCRHVKTATERLLEAELSRLNNAENLKICWRVLKGKPVDSATWFSDFRTYDEIKCFLKRFERRNRDLVKLETIGKTINKESILMLRITEGQGRPEKVVKKKILIQGLIHAREWVSTTTVQFIATEMVEEFKRGNSTVRALLKETEFLVIPVLNVDGYRWSWTRDRFWRKNRRDNVGNWTKKPLGYGVDLNRNFDDGMWGEKTKHKKPKSQSYPGEHPASEPETQAIQSLFRREKYIVATLDFHAAAQKILYPTPLPDHLAHVQLSGYRMTHLVFPKYHRCYPFEESPDRGTLGGFALRFFHVTVKVDAYGRHYRPYAVIVELTKTRRSHWAKFVLEPDQILSVGREWLEAVVTYAEYVKDHPLLVH